MWQKMLFGNLTLDSLSFLHEPILMITGAGIAVGAALVLGYLTIAKKWGWLWKEYIISVDHKKIGVMYFVLALVMLFRGFTDAMLMRTQQALAVGAHTGYLPPWHYDQVFTAHGVIMIFFMAMPFMFALFNWVVPLQIGARDVAYPYLNSLSFWLTFVGAMLVNISLLVGKFAATGWLAYPPLSGIVYSPGVGVDYYIWALQISGVGTLLAGINFVATILRMRCPGMSLFKMPVFTWTVLCASVLIILAFPVLTVSLGLLFLDRFFDMHFFTSGMGGNAMMYINLIWIWGHPEVYILVLPAFGIYSEVVATYCRKRLFGYNAMVWATISILFLSFIVWLHHFFTMGSGANVNAFFGIMTMIIAIPTGVKIFNWIFTMHRGRVQFSVPMLWTIGFIMTFSIGGMTGVLMSVPAVDFQMHNSVFLVAHFHNTIIGGVVFGYFAGLAYWFPKVFGFKLNEFYGKCAFWCWQIGFYVAFMPLYVLGFKGMTRRLNHYSIASGFHPYLIIALIGACIIGLGIVFQLYQIYVSVRDRKKAENIAGNDPWDGRTLEWSIPSPPPFYNFAVTPSVNDIDPYWDAKQKDGKQAMKVDLEQIKDIHMPKDTSIGFWIAIFSGGFGFGMVWHIHWLIAAGLIGMFVALIIRAFDSNTDYYLKAEDVKKMEASYQQSEATS